MFISNKNEQKIEDQYILLAAGPQSNWTPILIVRLLGKSQTDDSLTPCSRRLTPVLVSTPDKYIRHLCQQDPEIEFNKSLTTTTNQSAIKFIIHLTGFVHLRNYKIPHHSHATSDTKFMPNVTWNIICGTK